MVAAGASHVPTSTFISGCSIPPIAGAFLPASFFSCASMATAATAVIATTRIFRFIFVPLFCKRITPVCSRRLAPRRPRAKLSLSSPKCVLSGNPSAPHRRPPSSAVSALVLSLTAPLLCAYLRVSAPPRQNHSLRFPIPFHHGLIRGIELCVLYVSAVNRLPRSEERQ